MLVFGKFPKFPGIWETHIFDIFNNCDTPSLIEWLFSQIVLSVKNYRFFKKIVRKNLFLFQKTLIEWEYWNEKIKDKLFVLEHNELGMLNGNKFVLYTQRTSFSTLIHFFVM